MHDPLIRMTLVYSIVGSTLVAGAAVYAWNRHRTYWRKLRQSGNSRAKERELKRKRKQR